MDTLWPVEDGLKRSPAYTSPLLGYKSLGEVINHSPSTFEHYNDSITMKYTLFGTEGMGPNALRFTSDLIYSLLCQDETLKFFKNEFFNTNCNVTFLVEFINMAN